MMQNKSMIGLVMEAKPKYEPVVIPVSESMPLSESTISVAASPMEVPHPGTPAWRLPYNETKTE